ncbi:MAG: RNA 2',3'-cyclic phosphodiesterase [Desulfobacula sp.]|nr:RNA 2',3'-cyclic phosphodiesterase [Desulfobacula sp.]
MKENNKDIRAFIAVSLPDVVKQYLSFLQKKLLNSGIKASFPKPASLHLTLKFLGNISKTDISNIESCMEKAVMGIAVHNLSASGIGVFPSVKNVRVIWAGLSGRTDFTEKLATQLESSLFEEMNIQKEAKLFRPHLTLARVKGKIPPKTAAQLIKEFSTVTGPEFSVFGISLFQSELAPSGAVHKKIAFVPLNHG